jgi:predicted transcriptional regulator
MVTKAKALFMEINELVKIIDGKVLTDASLNGRKVAGAMGADLMSDVLASIQPEAALLTGLCNPQVVRTAQIADIRVIVLVRGKHPAQETIKLANEEDIPLITTQLGLFDACGLLYKAGLTSLELKTEDDCSSSE